MSGDRINKEYSEFAPAKINIFLHITGKRDDGYHLLESLILPIDLMDTVRVKRSDNELKVIVPGFKELESSKNLVAKAAFWYFDLAKIEKKSQGLEIFIDKKIPIAAGLGGGSSDAAATLRCLQKMYSHPVSDEEILSKCVDLGADVPVCFKGRPYLVGGIGDELLLSCKLEKLYFLLANPGYLVSTTDVYKSYEKNLIGTRLTNSIFSGRKSQLFLDAEVIKNLMHNDLETVTFNKYPDLSQMKATMIESGSLNALMAGSGSTLFAIFNNRDAAEVVKNKLEAIFSKWTFWLASSFD